MTHIGTHPLETARLTLRRLTPDDTEAFFAIMNDERVTRYLLFPRLLELSQAEDWIVRDMALYDNEPNFYLWAMECRETSALVGTISLHVVREDSDVGEVGYSLGQGHWGRGLAAEALRAVLGFAFHQVGFNRVEGCHSTRNPASGTVMRKAGMLYEGMAREKIKNAMGYHDTHMYGMLKRDY